jgi:hypothetical protein
MRVGLCLAAAGLLLSGCAGSLPTFLGGGPANNQVTSGTAPPAAGRPPATPRNALNSNDNCENAWEQNAYHYQCDPNANY